MKDKVYISIKGLQLMAQGDSRMTDEEEEAVEIISVGSYSVVNGKEYIKYEEVFEGESRKCTSLIRIADSAVEITKRGAVTAHLSFVPGKKTMTFYETPYGNIYLGIFSRDVSIRRTEESIQINIDYALELNYEQVSDCQVVIEITSSGRFSLEDETDKNKH